MDHLTGRFHTVHGVNATVQPRRGNQFEIILMTGKAAGNLWNVIERLLVQALKRDAMQS